LFDMMMMMRNRFKTILSLWHMVFLDLSFWDGWWITFKLFCHFDIWFFVWPFPFEMLKY
jgi:hypothetical protein